MKNEERPYIVYMHICPDGMRYIGATKLGIKKRWSVNKYGTSPFAEAVKKYGWENVDHVILYDNLTFEQARELEQEMIDAYDTRNPEKGYNRDRSKLPIYTREPRPIKCLDTGEVFPNCRQAAKKMDLDDRHILLALKRVDRQHVKGYSFCYANEEESND